MSLLIIRDLCKFYGGLKAVNKINFKIKKGEIVGLIGPNGAGKTSLFNCITGFCKVTSGDIFFDGENITNKEPEKICLKGIARTFQIPRTFRNMTVLDNIIVGALSRQNNLIEAKKRALRWLKFTGLIIKKDNLGSNITLADEKLLSIARILATEPKLILLDEAMSGLTPTEAEKAIKMVLKISDLGITVIIVEHVMEIVMPISKRVIVINNGEKIAEGSPIMISKDKRVIKSYLGSNL